MSHHVADTLTLLRRELLRYRRERAYWVGQILFPLAFVAFIGFGLDDVTQLPSGTSYVGHLATGVLALLVGSGAVGGGFSLIEDRESGFLRALVIAPVSRRPPGSQVGPREAPAQPRCRRTGRPCPAE